MYFKDTSKINVTKSTWKGIKFFSLFFSSFANILSMYLSFNTFSLLYLITFFLFSFFYRYRISIFFYICSFSTFITYFPLIISPFPLLISILISVIGTSLVFSTFIFKKNRLGWCRKKERWKKVEGKLFFQNQALIDCYSFPGCCK